MNDSQLLAETEKWLKLSKDSFYKGMQSVLVAGKGDIKTLILEARNCCSDAIVCNSKEGAIYFLYALNFLQECRFKKVTKELEELKSYNQDAAWEADLNDS